MNNLVFKQALEQYFTPTSTEWERIQDKLSFRSLAKDECLIKQGEVCHQLAFITQGMIRYCQYDYDNNEHTTCFAWENFFCAPFSSFIHSTPSFESLIALENTHLIEINKVDFFALVETIPGINLVYRKVLEAAYLLTEKHNYILQNYPATERYQTLVMHDHPTLLQRVPLKYIASYLGINPETLSRVRRKI
ncbi:Crp/Fnr family transcriptional regulator [Microscilla marina]|uniref:Catabolite gene activator protein, putative n=1 Tax=Microscilla marina ATCC 23134 TaxID=313606 RepID=A1ZE29_MICM2|nr:Crp/Fnr family transcriptional regulator [Microscilla marina]EAY31337.1 catabolite gene activator protein, putative [Microscilla marina ATCC 23134]